LKVSIGEASKITGVSISTLRRWEYDGKIKPIRTEGNHRRYDTDQILTYKGDKEKYNAGRITIGYARVSTGNKKDDLERQSKVIEMFCAAKGWQFEILTDIGSGLNYNKAGLLNLIKLIETQKVERLVLNYKDRLLRFGAEIIFEICKYHDVEIVIINSTEGKSQQEELAEDVLAIITVFSARLYGSRSHKNKSIIEQSKKMFNVEEVEVVNE
jgi:excisionase family DNA binding protein